LSVICLLLRWRSFPDQRELSSHAWKQSPDDTSDTQEERYRCAGLWLQRKPNRPAEHKLQNTGSPVGSLLGDGSKKAQNQDQGGKRCNGADQADGIDFKPMPLPAIIRVFSASALGSPICSDAYQCFPLIVLHELERGTSLLPLLDQ
jgi:hypothetical protein